MVAQPMLDAKVVLRWCRAALAGLAEAREEIDALNVFPVPDGDTGTNLYLTVESATEAAERANSENSTAAPAPVLDALARGALLGARGNSGVISRRCSAQWLTSSANPSDRDAEPAGSPRL